MKKKEFIEILDELISARMEEYRRTKEQEAETLEQDETFEDPMLTDREKLFFGADLRTMKAERLKSLQEIKRQSESALIEYINFAICSGLYSEMFDAETSGDNPSVSCADSSLYTREP